MSTFRPIIIVPHYNHLTQLLPSLAGLMETGIPLLVVDDGSEPGQREHLLQHAQEIGFEVLCQSPNQGKGAAVMAGLTHAQQQGFTHGVQVDADGQHDAGEIPRFLASAEARPGAMICGAPVFGEDAPWVRVWGRKLTDGVVLLETWKLGIRDALFGFRVYPLGDILSVVERHGPGARMDFDAEILVTACWDGMPLHFIDTPVIYPDHGVSHFRYVRDNLRMVGMHLRLLFRMLLRSPKLLIQRLGKTGTRVTGE